ncbi:MAG: hypothetical protein ABIQ39_04655 [Ilumatobacteraceae bacterium]
MLAGIIALESNPVWGRQMLEWVWSQGHDPGEYRLIKTYLSAVRLPVQITPEIEIEEALGRSLVGLMIAEWKQSSGDPFGALQIVEQLEPTSGVVLSLCDLYAQTESYDQIIELTDGLTNQDDVTALLLVFRGQAFRQLGHNESARLVLTEALRARSRASEIRFRALVERALAYHADGKKGMARKDLDRIRAEDASYPGLAEAFTALGLDTVVPEPDQVADASVISPTTPIPLPPPHLR